MGILLCSHRQIINPGISRVGGTHQDPSPAPGHPTNPTTCWECCLELHELWQNSWSSTMNPVYSPVQPGAPYGNPKNMAYTGINPVGLESDTEEASDIWEQLQKGAYYTQPVYAAQPHVIHHTTVVQPNSIPSAIYPAPVAAPRTNGVAMGMVAGTTMAMSADPESTIVCNSTSLTWVPRPLGRSTSSVCKNKVNQASARVTLCIL
ncbi:hypothetical protein WISP_54292 [Willisornis vidua]|uniref:Uncharacterized protein n=1 Tax=Willisornis vidua TaxID=1566151 RepID=A0ABQ9DH87_9PASS|nr:hypothetical protein WISP_54292 [Willisornis vidua]